MNHLLERNSGTLKAFNIPFMGLKKDVHHFQYIIDSNFFQEFENSPIEEGVLEVDLEFNKKHNFFELNFQIEGKIRTQCDRCSDDFYMAIDFEEEAIVQMQNAENTSDEKELDILTIPNDSTAINVAHLIYEITVLSLPIRKNCSEDSVDGKKCNPKVLKILNRNNQSKEEETTDPRWEALLKFKNNHKNNNNN